MGVYPYRVSKETEGEGGKNSKFQKELEPMGASQFLFREGEIMSHKILINDN